MHANQTPPLFIIISSSIVITILRWKDSMQTNWELTKGGQRETDLNKREG